MIKCIIASQAKIRKYNNVKSISLDTDSGILQILPKHAEFFAMFKKASVHLLRHKNVRINQGILHIHKDFAVIIL